MFMLKFRFFCGVLSPQPATVLPLVIMILMWLVIHPILRIVFVYLDKVQQAAETPRDWVEPLWAGIGPVRVHQLSQVTVCEVAVPLAWWVILLGDVAGSEMANAQEVTGAPDEALLLSREHGQPWNSQALLGALPTCRWETKQPLQRNRRFRDGRCRKTIASWFEYSCFLFATVQSILVSKAVALLDRRSVFMHHSIATFIL